MGEIQKVTCNQCGRSWECKTGCGLIHGRMDFIVKEFPYRIQQKINADFSKHPLSFFDFAYHIAECPVCQSLVSVPTLSIEDSGNVFTGSCPECGKILYPKEIIACPVCHDTSLSVQEIGGWD